jgi:pimeloyl-ACP methyl ester carboxylesterase
MGPESLRADYLSAQAHDVRGRLDGIEVPALIIAGEHDPLVPVWLSEDLADELRDATVAVIADTAHVPQLERPDAVDLLTAAFLARLELSLTGDA